MITISVRFFSSLNDFLSRQQRQRRLVLRVDPQRSIKDILESLGVPHVEIDRIQLHPGNGPDSREVNLDYHPAAEDAFTVYPEAHQLTGEGLIPPSPPPHRFLLDVHLGKLARLLRLLGFDSLYRNDLTDPVLARLSRVQRRVLLTQDRRLLMRREVTQGLMIRSQYPRRQLVEVIQRYELRREARPFTRCMKCNGLLREVTKAEVYDRLPPKVKKWRDRFSRCPDCGNIYWQGTHHARMKAWVEELLAGDESTGT